MKKFFITGTDTDVGKTHVGQILMVGFRQLGLKTLGYKPISAGCERQNGALVNDDALQYQTNASVKLPLSEVNPIAFEPPIAPHIAAQQAGVSLSLASLQRGLNTLESYQPDCILTEGAGGWRLPMGDGTFLSDFPVSNNMSVILVVGLRLGCLNHAILTAEAIQADGARLAGWIGNHVDPDMLNQIDNINTLRSLLGEPLGLVSHATTISPPKAAAFVETLLG